MKTKEQYQPKYVPHNKTQPILYKRNKYGFIVCIENTANVPMRMIRHVHPEIGSDYINRLLILTTV